MLKKSAELAGDAFVTDVGFDQMRANYIKERAFWNEGGPVDGQDRRRFLRRPDGRVFRPFITLCKAEKLSRDRFIHGGGFVVGSPATHDRVCRILADRTGAAVVSVDYHLSPESKYPTNIQECAIVAKYLHEHGAEHGIDGNDLSFAGDSGGAVLSMATNLWLRDRRGRQLLREIAASVLRLLRIARLHVSPPVRLGYRRHAQGRPAVLQRMLAERPCRRIERAYVDMLSNDLKTGMAPRYIAAAGLDPLARRQRMPRSRADEQRRRQRLRSVRRRAACLCTTRACSTRPRPASSTAPNFWKTRRA